MLARNKSLPALRNSYTTAHIKKQNIRIVFQVKEKQYKLISQLLDNKYKCKF